MCEIKSTVMKIKTTKKKIKIKIIKTKEKVVISSVIHCKKIFNIQC